RALLQSRIIAATVPASPALSIRRLAGLVQACGRFLPGTTCLVQALTLQSLLCRAGPDSRVQIGVAKDGPRPLEAHAWVDCAGEVLLDDADGISRYTLLASLHA